MVGVRNPTRISPRWGLRLRMQRLRRSCAGPPWWPGAGVTLCEPDGTGAQRRADGAARRPYHGSIFSRPFRASGNPQSAEPQALRPMARDFWKNFLTLPQVYGIHLPVMQNVNADCGTLQMRNGELIPPSSWPSPPGEGGPRGHYGEPKLMNPERATESATNWEAEILTTDYRMNADRGPSKCGMRALRAATGEGGMGEMMKNEPSRIR